MLQYFFTLETQEAKLWSDLRTTAYISYIENSAKMKVFDDRAKLEDAWDRARALRNAARFSIALYGSGEVIEKMAAYAPIEERSSDKNFENASLELFAAMRNEILPKHEKVSVELLYPILFPSKVYNKGNVGPTPDTNQNDN